MSAQHTIAALQRTVSEQEVELLRLRAEANRLADVALERAGEVERLRALLASCDERLDELGCGALAGKETP